MVAGGKKFDWQPLGARNIISVKLTRYSLLPQKNIHVL